MPARMSRNRMNVRPGDPCFLVATNLCDMFELGKRPGNDYWLLAEMVGPEKEFLFNGRIFVPSLGQSGTVIDNFPKGPTPKGWTMRPRVHGEGYELVSDGVTLFGYEVLPERVCKVAVNIYAKDGGLVAESLEDEFLLHRHPAMIGRGGIYFSD